MKVETGQVAVVWSKLGSASLILCFGSLGLLTQCISIADVHISILIADLH
jgi:hypothetical protein